MCLLCLQLESLKNSHEEAKKLLASNIEKIERVSLFKCHQLLPYMHTFYLLPVPLFASMAYM